jgi:hypothetical protein
MSQVLKKGTVPFSFLAVSFGFLHWGTVPFLGFLLASCGSVPPRATEELTVWRPVGAWSGHGLMQTDAFISDTGQLRINWDARASAGAEGGTLRIAVHSAVSGRMLALALDHRGPGSDVAYVAEDPRSFYLVIDAAGLDWRVEVAEGLPATRREKPSRAPVSPASRQADR